VKIICYAIKSKGRFTFAREEDEYSNNIKLLREQNGFTQQDLAEKSQSVPADDYFPESGRYNPSIFLAYHIARVFNLTIEERIFI